MTVITGGLWVNMVNWGINKISENEPREMSNNISEKIGITTTIPVELVFAAQKTPVDLNNIFITSPLRMDAIAAAELDGYPRTVCGWIKGLYGMVAKYRVVDKMVAVTEGDCSQTHALMETLGEKGVEIIPFSFPFDRDRQLLLRQLEKLAFSLQTTLSCADEQYRRLREVRETVWEIDRLTWEENRVSGAENHYYQVSCSDFEGNPERFAAKVSEFVREAKQRKPFEDKLRLGFIGVPPIFDDLYQFIEERGAQVVFNEVQRQFSLPHASGSLLEDYLAYTYPYHVQYRIEDILEQISLRKIDALVHYTQSFCFRQIEDICFRKKLPVPILTIEAESPGPLDARTQLRLETFLSMLK